MALAFDWPGASAARKGCTTFIGARNTNVSANALPWTRATKLKENIGSVKARNDKHALLTYSANDVRTNKWPPRTILILTSGTKL